MSLILRENTKKTGAPHNVRLYSIASTRYGSLTVPRDVYYDPETGQKTIQRTICGADGVVERTKLELSEEYEKSFMVRLCGIMFKPIVYSLTSGCEGILIMWEMIDMWNKK
ncbi:hypothetical protein Rs2_41221 [Raphanus sativus]|nr:hypothetical protein Rs2_41221 [Raphanus sativus]